MNVLYLIPHLGKGGAEELVVELSIETSKKDSFRVGILAFHDVHEAAEHIESLHEAPVSIEYVFKRKILYLSFRRRIRNYFSYLLMPVFSLLIWRKIVKGKIDIVHVNLTLPGYSLFFLRFWRFFSKQKPIFLETFHSNTHLLKPISKLINIWSWRNCDHLVTEIFEEDIKVVRGYAPKVPISFIPFGYASGRLEVTRPSFSKMDVINICTVSRVRFFEKKIDVMLDVVRGLVSAGYHLNFSLCGDGEDFNLVKDIVVKESLEDFVTLRGYVDNARDIYSENDIALVATVAGESGVSGMMALDAGCFLIGIESTDQEIEVSALNEGDSKIYFSNDVLNLVEFCSNLIENPVFQTLYRSICLKRKESNIENFELFGTRYLDLYHGLKE